MNILCVLASPTKANSVSRTLAHELLDKLKKENPHSQLTLLDLSDNPPPHWGAAEVIAAQTPLDQRTGASIKTLQLSDTLCRQLLDTNVLVIAAPMWNFSVPSVLKAWIDHIVRAGITFQYTSTGPRGLLGALDKLYIVEATGGIYLEPAAKVLNHLGPYLTHIFQFLGAKQVFTISAPGTAMQPEVALQHARSSMQQLYKEG
jgi:FMN-dependent NADH-azoreductase